MATLPRMRLKALSQGRGDGQGFAVPLAAQFAARINERDWEDFAFDPTQLANGMRDLVDALRPDGIPVTLPEFLTGGPLDLASSEHLRVAVEATDRLRASLGDRVALVACLPDAEAFLGGAATLIDVAKAFLAAGADAIVVLDPVGASTSVPLTSLANIARFHQALALGCDPGQGLARVERIPLIAPRRAAGVAITENDVPRAVDLDVLEEWVDAVRG
ncbi:hypothetical protein [Nocardia sp. CA-135398]|uniref:hypothetical protein n=1 Tax=Nocardia sp. CA-135398 TaxID=3239977 RepID=UPI003D993671